MIIEIIRVFSNFLQRNRSRILPILFLFACISIPPKTLKSQAIQAEWARAFTSNLSFVPYDMIMDSLKNIYITGGFYSTADFDPGPGIYNLTSNGYEDAFIAKLDSAGNLIWAKKLRWELC